MSFVSQIDLDAFLRALGYSEEPLGMLYTDSKPTGGVAPKVNKFPTADDEAKGPLDWQSINRNWSCVLGNLWIARNRKSAAYFAKDRAGCLGGAFSLGFLKPQLDLVCSFVSTGIPDRLEGEHYMASPELARKYYDDLDPDPAPGRFCVFKPLSQFGSAESPEFITFFARPEVISGVHQLTMFVTRDPEAVMSPWGAGCANIVTWPRKYQSQGKLKACLGGWDPSCRKYLKTDEITLTVPSEMFKLMVDKWRGSFLTTKTWGAVRQRAAKSRRTWGEDS